MNIQLLHDNFNKLPAHAARVLKDFMRYPSGINGSYVIGYFASCAACSELDNEINTYFQALVGQIESNYKVAIAVHQELL